MSACTLPYQNRKRTHETTIDSLAAASFVCRVSFLIRAGPAPAVARGQTTVIPAGSTWKYFDQGVDLGTAWRDPTFDDSSWPSGQAIFGYGNGNELTVVSFGDDPSNKHVTTYFRRTFVVDNPPAIGTMILSLLYDDGIVAYLNGFEVARGNMPPTHDFDTFAAAAIGGADESDYNLTAVVNLLVQGENVLAAEVHQSSRTSSDLSFDLGAPGLTTFAIPEPGTATMIFLGFGLLLTASRHRRCQGMA